MTFTGTRQGMSLRQLQQLEQVLGWFAVVEPSVRQFHHGAAIGADTEAALIAKTLGWQVVGHPGGSDPLARNRRMVALCQLVIAAPVGDAEELRSGTWATIRHARKVGKPVVMLAR